MGVREGKGREGREGRGHLEVVLCTICVSSGFPSFVSVEHFLWFSSVKSQESRVDFKAV
jgi:hypothetical protein